MLCGEPFLADFEMCKVQYMVFGIVKILYDKESPLNEGAVGSRRLSVCGVGIEKMGKLQQALA